MNTAVAIVLIAALSMGQAQSALETVRDLYADAAFEEALAALTKVSSESSPHDARLAGEYRIFTLFALGRTADAETAAEALIRRDPLSGLQSPDASPRIHSMFGAVRSRVLPQVIRDKYRSGRAAIETREFADAARELGDARQLIDEAAAAGVADPGLADLRDLVDGFLVLARSQPGVSAPATDPMAASAAAAAPRIYGSKDTDVTPPAIISQALPDVPASLRATMASARRPMMIAVTIDERGQVRESHVVIPMNPVYDRLVVGAAKSWRYRPATKDGAPVPYQRVIAITVADASR